MIWAQWLGSSPLQALSLALSGFLVLWSPLELFALWLIAWSEKVKGGRFRVPENEKGWKLHRGCKHLGEISVVLINCGQC